MSLASLASWGAAGCSSPSGADAYAGACPAGFLGDVGQPPDFEVQAVLADQSVATVADGGTVPLLFPPQGGRVVFIGVRATNIDGCALKLTGALRDPTSQQVRFETRTTQLIPTGDGWGQSGIVDATRSVSVSNFANVPVCPNQWATRDVFGQPYELEVTIEDRRGTRRLTKILQVTPECAEPANAPQCACICRAGYNGHACDEADSGAADAAGAADATGATDAGDGP